MCSNPNHSMILQFCWATWKGLGGLMGQNAHELRADRTAANSSIHSWQEKPTISTICFHLSATRRVSAALPVGRRYKLHTAYI